MMWIIPTMRLPTQNETVLFVDSGGSYHLGYLNRKNKWYAYDFDGRVEKVAAWMPLPLWRKDMTEFIVRAENKGLECVGEVIRCKDCKHANKSKVFKDMFDCEFMGATSQDAESYCSLAERREENE